MAKREKPNSPYSSEELKMLLGKTTDKLIERAEARSSNRLQNLALPGKGEVYQFQLRDFVQNCVRARDVTMATGYELFLEKKMNECGFGDCMGALHTKIDDLRAIDYFLGRVDEEFRVGTTMDNTLNPNPEKGLKGLFMKTDRISGYAKGERKDGQ